MDILTAPGDLLVLDYRSSTEAVLSAVGSYYTDWVVTGIGFTDFNNVGYGTSIYSNEGTYESGNNLVTFENIERISAIGSSHNDLLIGTSLLLGFNQQFFYQDATGYGSVTGSQSARGDDYLRGATVMTC